MKFDKETLACRLAMKDIDQAHDYLCVNVGLCIGDTTTKRKEAFESFLKNVEKIVQKYVEDTK